MKWIENFTLIMRANLQTLREKIEDPERMLHQLLIDMEEELDRVRASVAEAIADEIQMRKRAESARLEAGEWLERAENALKRGDDGSAKAALEQKLLAEERAEALDGEYGKQKAATSKLQRSVRDLEEKIRQARQRRTLLLARLTRADSAGRIQRNLERTESRSAFAQFGRLEERVERAEARSEAYDRLEGRDPAAEELSRQFKEKEREGEVQSELEDLRRRMDRDQGKK
jgi:phage shock protein A